MGSINITQRLYIQLSRYAATLLTALNHQDHLMEPICAYFVIFGPYFPINFNSGGFVRFDVDGDDDSNVIALARKAAKRVDAGSPASLGKENGMSQGPKPSGEVVKKHIGKQSVEATKYVVGKHSGEAKKNDAAKPSIEAAREVVRKPPPAVAVKTTGGKRADEAPNEVAGNTPGAADKNDASKPSGEATKEAVGKPSDEAAKAGDSKSSDGDKEPAEDEETEEDVADADEEEEEETDLGPPRTCLNGIPAEYCAAVVQILLYIGLFIGGFIILR